MIEYIYTCISMMIDIYMLLYDQCWINAKTANTSTSITQLSSVIEQNLSSFYVSSARIYHWLHQSTPIVQQHAWPGWMLQLKRCQILTIIMYSCLPMQAFNTFLSSGLPFLVPRALDCARTCGSKQTPNSERNSLVARPPLDESISSGCLLDRYTSYPSTSLTLPVWRE